MEPFTQVDESYFLIDSWRTSDPHLIAGFTTRNGGVSKKAFNSLNLGLHVNDDPNVVLKNREIVAEKIDFPLKHWVVGEQIHGVDMKLVTEMDKGKGSTSLDDSIKKIDGLITKTKGILCTAFFADCVPLYFFAPKHGYIGLAHAGWRGTVHGIARKMVDRLKQVGIKPSEILVAIGPSISQSEYEVNDKIIEYMDPSLIENTVIQKDTGKFLLDLKQLNVEILLQSGVIRHNIEVTSYCTFQQEQLFYSHRRDRGKTGRMLGFIGFMPSSD